MLLVSADGPRNYPSPAGEKVNLLSCKCPPTIGN